MKKKPMRHDIESPSDPRQAAFHALAEASLLMATMVDLAALGQRQPDMAFPVLVALEHLASAALVQTRRAHHAIAAEPGFENVGEVFATVDAPCVGAGAKKRRRTSATNMGVPST